MQVELDQVFYVVGVYLDVEAVRAAPRVAQSELHLVRQLRPQVRIAAKTKTVRRVGCAERMSETGVRRPRLIDRQSVLNIPGCMTAEGLVVRQSHGRKTLVPTQR